MTCLFFSWQMLLESFVNSIHSKSLNVRVISYLEGFSKALCLVLTPLTYDELLITMHKRWSFGWEFLQLMWTQPQESVLVFLIESRLMILVLKISKISFQKIGKFFFICSPFRYVWRKHRLTSIFKIYNCVLLMNVFDV